MSSMPDLESALEKRAKWLEKNINMLASLVPPGTGKHLSTHRRVYRQAVCFQSSRHSLGQESIPFDHSLPTGNLL